MKHLEEHSPQGLGPEQSTTSDPLPGQNLPLKAGAGLLQALCRNLAPPSPQVTEHLEYSDHSPQAPLMAGGGRKKGEIGRFVGVRLNFKNYLINEL